MKHFTGIIFSAVLLLYFSFSTPALASDDILIGFSGPLSGLAADYGLDLVNGIEQAIKELNEAGGVTVAGKKYQFKLEKLDDRIDPTQAVNNARRFRSKGALAVFNGVFSTCAAMMNINQEKGNEFLVMAFTSTPKITKMKNKLTVVAPGPFDSFASIFVEWALSRGLKKCGMMVTLGAYGDEWRQEFKRIYEKKGGTITADRPANYYTETDFSAQLTAVLATNPQVILIGGPWNATALVIEQARSMGYKGEFIMIDQSKQDQIREFLNGYSLMGNLIGSAGVSHIPPRPGQDFGPRFRGTFKRAANIESVFTYTFMFSLARAIEAAQSVNDVKKIRAAFSKIFPFLATEFPMEVHGITREGRLKVFTGTQIISNGEPRIPVMYDWWSTSDSEHEKARKVSQIDKSVPLKRAKIVK